MGYDFSNLGESKPWFSGFGKLGTKRSVVKIYKTFFLLYSQMYMD